MPHVHPSRPPGATASRGGRSPVLAEREASSTQVPEEEGVELRRTADGKVDGVMATRPFAAGETVMVGFLVGGLTGNDSHATQVGPGRWARHGGLGPMVNHSCDPNGGVRLNDGQAFDFVARQPIGAGQELTFDYAMRNFTIDHFPAGYERPRRAPDVRDRLVDLSGGGGSIGPRPRPIEHGHGSQCGWCAAGVSRFFRPASRGPWQGEAFDSGDVAQVDRCPSDAPALGLTAAVRKADTRSAMRVAIVSTYPPRACGIGTFSRDLRDALLAADGVSAVDLAAIVRDEGIEQEPEVAVLILQERGRDYAAAARVLDRRGDDVVVLQHEYGIFGGPDGAHVLLLARELRQPMVLTLHTVLASPSARQAETLSALCDLATLVCVFTETARRMILDARLVAPERVRVLPHGGPKELRYPDRERRRRFLRLPRRTGGGTPDGIDASRSVLATFGLISPGKGIETAIAAMPAIVERHPKALYLIAGQTHPEVARRHGEEYRISLERLTNDLDLGDHVLFDDRFLGTGDLSAMLAATTICLTPYRSREQIVSGALTFALVAGCPAVSTPYYYAEDMLASGAGVIVPFDDPGALAVAVNGLLGDPRRLDAARGAARTVGHKLTWPQVGRQTAEVLREAIALGAPTTVRRPAPITLPRARTSHLLTLVDDVGIIQHADGIAPARSSGYCTDDVARLAIVALGLHRTTGMETYDRMLAMSLGFLRHAWDAERQGMHNLLSYDRRWLDEPHGGDHLGRAAWALGEVVGSEPPPAVLEPSRTLLREMLPTLGVQRSPRTVAFAILGLAHADPAAVGEDAEAVLRVLAQRLAGQQRANAAPDWYWAEDELAYDNGRLPQALIAAGARLGDEELLGAGVRALDWYAGELGSEGPYVRLVGHHGRRRGEPPPGDGDEQPLDGAALVEAEVEAYAATGAETHARRAVHAFEWFLGRNRLELSVHDFTTGGCHDGLGEHTVNLNEGAESTLAYLQALLVLDTAGLQATLPT